MNRLALLALAVASAPAPATRRQTVIDRFTYPGQSAEAGRFNARWEAYMRRVNAAGASGDAQMQSLNWMIGLWTAEPRDYPSSMTDPSKATPSPASAATIDWTVGKRWVRISFVAEPWHVDWNYYLGYDAVSRRWLLYYLASASLVFERPIRAAGWTGDRLVFSPVTSSYKGFTHVQRFVIARTAPDAFRIVNEVRMPSGSFVAMDDVSFTRRTSTE